MSPKSSTNKRLNAKCTRLRTTENKTPCSVRILINLRSSKYNGLILDPCLLIWSLAEGGKGLHWSSVNNGLSWSFRNYMLCIHFILSREGLILRLSILPCPQGWVSWSIPVDGLMMRRMSAFHQNWGGMRKSIPSALEISLDPRDFPRASPSGNLLGLGKSLGRRGWVS